jgi:hypothetical protein
MGKRDGKITAWLRCTATHGRVVVMQFIKFIGLWFREALWGSLDWAQAAVFITIIVAGGLGYEAPDFAKAHEFQMILDIATIWKGALIALGAVVITRLIYAPYRLWSKERSARIAAENTAGSPVKGRIIQSGSAYDVVSDDNFLVVKNSVAAPTNINLPQNPHENHRIEIKASMSNCVTNPIFLNGNGNRIDGNDRFAIQFDLSSYTITFLGGDWHIT